MRSRGFTFTEMLIALVLLAVALSGLLGLWAFVFSTTRHSQDLGVGYNIARQEMEKVKNIGFLMLPESATPDTPLWTDYYDGLGNATAAASAHFTATTTVWTLPDANGQKTTACRRTVRVQVTAREGGEVVFDSTTYLVRGGI